MSPNDVAPVVRLYLRLTEALQRMRREPFNAPVTVAEIYQELVPYRSVRSEMGFDMNAYYEHALLRLLAGEGEHVRVEPAHAAEEMRRELRSANPNLSIYREYAACDVWVERPTAVAATATAAMTEPELDIFTLDDEPRRESAPAASAPTGAADARARAGAVADDRAAPTRAAAPDSTAATPAVAAAPKTTAATRPKAPAASAPVEAAPSEAAAAAAEPDEAALARTEMARCSFCDSALPQQRSARFCPFCGADQTTRPCPACGEVIEPGWVYCIACGAAGQ